MEQWELELLQEYLQKHFSIEQINGLLDTGTPLTGKQGLRRQLAEIDQEYFCKAYLPHYFNLPFSSHHKEMFKDLKTLIDRKGGTKICRAAPREHAKSTQLTLGLPLYCTLYGLKHFIVLTSDTEDQASGYLESIQDEMDENPAIIEDFGQMKGLTWNVTEMVTVNDVCIIAKGIGGKIRGLKYKNHRPDLIILDDIENDKNVKSEESKRWTYDEWFMKAVLRAGGTGLGGKSLTDIVVMGTILESDSVLKRIIDNPLFDSKIYKAVISFAQREDLWEEWRKIALNLENENRMQDAEVYFKANEHEMLRGTKVLWPEKHTYYSLMLAHLASEMAFNSELQNEPIDKTQCLFHGLIELEAGPTLDELREEFLIYGSCDPSLGKKAKGGDYSAIVDVARHKKTGQLWCIYADLEVRHPDKIIEDIFGRAQFYKENGIEYEEFVVETVQFQEFFASEIKKRSAEKGIYLPISELKQTADKVLRITRLQPDIKNKYLRFVKGLPQVFIEQLKTFPKAKKDDGPDALEMSVNAAKNGISRAPIGFAIGANIEELGGGEENWLDLLRNY
ncbi:phage terminase large subunit [Paenibacillus oleatilyticus]|uniref:phage terminase large subunit n=1 Tax=Paenibacillus oleatilyticus TaxID=2594886 RepID=UPI001C1FA4E6|nr:phage terminase large subunit [Paenibacillus oleatilyticus]MBU7314062.1 phage terminase large subunit [Paenibacillus oleatilyticus]